MTCLVWHVMQVVTPSIEPAAAQLSLVEKASILIEALPSKDVADKMASLAGSFVDAKDEIVSLLQVGEAARSNQVLLRVRFAEVSRSAMTELGVNLFTSPTGINNVLGRTTTEQFAAPGFTTAVTSSEAGWQ